MSIKKIKFATLMCSLLALFSLVYLIQSFSYQYWHQYSPGAGFVPAWCSGITLVLSLICLIQSIKADGIKISEVLPKDPIGRSNILIALAGLVFFAIFSEILGLVVSGIVMLTLLFGRSMKWYKALIYGVVVTACCFILFKVLLGVPVPVNQFGW